MTKWAWALAGGPLDGQIVRMEGCLRLIKPFFAVDGCGWDVYEPTGLCPRQKVIFARHKVEFFPKRGRKRH